MKPWAVLGCGPAGLMAAHAIALSGRPVTIFSQPNEEGEMKKSILGGAQFLHMPIVGVNDIEPDVTIRYELHGDADTYRRKVYGDDPMIPFVSMQYLEDKREQKAWNLQATYDRLWEMLAVDRMQRAIVTPAWLEANKDYFEVIVSSLPATTLCLSHHGLSKEMHHFIRQQVLISGECILDGLENTIVYDGTKDRSWYRCSNLFGHGGTEWSSIGPRPPVADVVRINKPIRTNCDCHPKVIRVGRYGEYKKGVLTHHAFYKVWELIKK